MSECPECHGTGTIEFDAGMGNFERDCPWCRVAELEQQLKWQPIETAPRDGIEVLVRGEDFTAVAMGCSDGDWLAAFDRDLDPIPQPTHWMPIPPLDAAKEKPCQK